MEKRKIIHIDMDAFFASVEQRDFAEYRGRPVIVGGKPDTRGVVAACSYEARKFGIHSAMPSSRASRLCPDAIFVRPRFQVYRTVSQEIHKIFHSVTNLVEPLSLDEAYLDVSHSDVCCGSATLIAKQLKQRILQEISLTASAGISYNKFLAKIASDMDKPDGLFVIRPEQGERFVETLNIRKFHGIGQATEVKMNALGIHTGLDLKKWGKEELIWHFGKAGQYYYQIARGIDPRSVNPYRVRKSLGTETTFSIDIDDRDEMLDILGQLSDKIAKGLNDKKLTARTVTLKVKYADFELITRSHTDTSIISSQQQIMSFIPDLLAKTQAGQRKVRLLGVSVSNLDQIENEINEDQLYLFDA